MRYALEIKNWKFQAGFTLVELLIVLSVISVITGLGFVSLRDFSDRQVLSTSTKNFASALQLARSRAQSQVKPPACGDNPLTGYQVSLTCSDTPCLTYTRYIVTPVCGSQPAPAVASGDFPSTISVTADVPSLVFETLSGLVNRPDGSTAATKIRLSGKTKTEMLDIYHDGRIVHTGGT